MHASPAKKSPERRPRSERPKYPLTAFPSLTIPVLFYVVLAVFGGAAVQIWPTAPALGWPMPTGVRLTLTWGDLIVLVGLIALFADIVKSASSGTAAIVNHMLSVALLALCLILFLLAPTFSSPAFLALLVMLTIDVVAGFTISTFNARRDVTWD